MQDVTIAARTRAQRCAACHGDLGSIVITCPDCSTALHAECRRELERCPTIGCAGLGALKVPPLVAPPARPRPPIFRFAPLALVIVGPLLTASLFIAHRNPFVVMLVVLLHALVLPLLAACLGRRRREREGFLIAWAAPSAFAFMFSFLVFLVLFFWMVIHFFTFRGWPYQPGEPPELLVGAFAIAPAIVAWGAAKVASARRSP